MRRLFHQMTKCECSPSHMWRATNFHVTEVWSKAITRDITECITHTSTLIFYTCEYAISPDNIALTALTERSTISISMDEGPQACLPLWLSLPSGHSFALLLCWVLEPILCILTQ